MDEDCMPGMLTDGAEVGTNFDSFFVSMNNHIFCP